MALRQARAITNDHLIRFRGFIFSFDQPSYTAFIS
jgi:hypothetical protein